MPISTAKYIADVMATHRMVGVPYTDDMMAKRPGRLQGAGRSECRYRRAVEPYGKGTGWRNFDGQPQLTEMDALIAYLQVLGTMVDFSTFIPTRHGKGADMETYSLLREFADSWVLAGPVRRSFWP